MKQYEMFELSFQGPEPGEDQVAVNLTAEFIVDGKSCTVRGFYAGEGTYKVRFLPLKAGWCTYQVRGIAELSGEETVEPAGTAELTEAEDAAELTRTKGSPKPAKSRGPVRACGYHFEYADHTKYLPFGTTVYALVHQKEELVNQTMETLKASPFNKSDSACSRSTIRST